MEPSTSLYGERGAGGKFRKPPARKPPSTPYDRPPAAKPRVWLSKVVDPAYRLLSGGASKILPSFLFKSVFSETESLEDGHDSEMAPSNNEVVKCASSHAAFTSSKGAFPSEVPDRFKRISEFDELLKGEVKNSFDNNEISRIEQLIEGKTFSRDEISHLMEVLNSRVLEVSEVEQEKSKVVNTTAGENEGNLLTYNTQQEDKYRAMLRTPVSQSNVSAGENEGNLLAHNARQEDNNRAMLRTPVPQSNMVDEIGASPIDIARSYMGSRKFGQGPDHYSDFSKADGLVEPASNSLIPSPSPKASPCWPGAMVPDQRGYVTPVGQRGRYGLHDFPRTPYSRTIYSKSRGELIRSQADGRYPNSSSNFFQKSRTPIYGQGKTTNDVLRDGFGSVGPIRRMRNKFASEARSRGSIFSMPLAHSPSIIESPNVSKRFLPTVEQNLEPGETSNSSRNQSAESGERRSEDANVLLNPSTSQTVRRILEQLDRNKPTPKEKAAELKLATAWRKPAASNISENSPKVTTSLANVSDKNSDLASESNDCRRIPDGQGRYLEVVRETKKAVDAHQSAPSLGGALGRKAHVYAESSSVLKTISDSQLQSSHAKASSGSTDAQKEKDVHFPGHDQSNEQNFKFVPNTSSFGLPKKSASQSTGSKPNLPSISISKPHSGRVGTSENGISFTFPVSTSFGVSSEPPTPSVMPSSSPGLLPVPLLPAQGSTTPSYSFGAKKSSPRLVFSFPSTSNASTINDTSDLKFKFGSDKNSRLSFKSVGKGAFCY